jgi:uncharacterized protein (DUF58 family)
MFWAERLGLRALMRRVRRWSLSRFPRRRSVTLTQKRIYILPTGAGMAFLLLLTLLLLLAINYENNLAYALTFLLASLFVVSILHTYGNLAGLQVTALSGQNCFRGEYAGFTLQLRAAGGREHEQLTLCWEEGPPQTVDLTEQRMVQVELACPAARRGRLDPGPLRLETRFPLGLFRAWTWLDTGLSALVYPAPEPCRLPAGGTGGEGDESSHAQAQGVEDYQGLVRYQEGVSPHQIAWKVYARGQGLHVKQYASPASEELWLDWDVWPAASDEARLSGICHWVLELTRRQQPFGLHLPGTRLAPETGEVHRLRALTALALFGQESDECR